MPRKGKPQSPSKFVVKEAQSDQDLLISRANQELAWNKANLILLFNILDQFDKANDKLLAKLPEHCTRQEKERFESISRHLRINQYKLQGILAQRLVNRRSDQKDLFLSMYHILMDTYLPENPKGFCNEEKWIKTVRPCLKRMSNRELILFCEFMQLVGKRVTPSLRALYLLEIAYIANNRQVRETIYDMHQDKGLAKQCFALVYKQFNEQMKNIFQNYANAGAFNAAQSLHDFNSALTFLMPKVHTSTSLPTTGVTNPAGVEVPAKKEECDTDDDEKETASLFFSYEPHAELCPNFFGYALAVSFGVIAGITATRLSMS